MINTSIVSNATKMFLDPAGRSGIARYDRIKYPQFEKLRKKQAGFHWGMEEVECSTDQKDFRSKLNAHEQHIFTSNIKRQIVLDTKQGRGPSEIFAPIATLPEMESLCHVWNHFEQIHGESYTQIIRGIYSNPTEVLDNVLSIEPVLKCAESIAAPYDELEYFNNAAYMHSRAPDSYPEVDSFEHKAALWRCLNAVNALEGIRFYVSFACSWAFAETKRMEGNAKIIKLIARDENIHLAVTQQIIKLLPSDDPDFIGIKQQNYDSVWNMFYDVVMQEIEWAGYLFKDGSMIGLNYELAVAYIKWLANKRLAAIGLPEMFSDAPKSNPLPWTQKWIAGSDVQVAPQETEIPSYVIGGFKKAGSTGKFKNFEL